MSANAPVQRVALVVHGRFHGFDLARELIRLGHEVTVFTNYPALLGPRFGVPSSAIRSFIAHGVLARTWNQLAGQHFHESSDRVLHQMFGRWAARSIELDAFDVIHCFSGVAEELMLKRPHHGLLKTIVRGSAHIGRQLALLAEEERRVGHAIEKPSAWMVAREEREYQLADLVFVLSTFAQRSFVEAGIPAQRIRLLPLGAQMKAFAAGKDSVQARIRRIVSGERLRVLYVGTFSAQKGAVDLSFVAKQLSGKVDFRAVGSVAEDAEEIAAGLASHVDFRGKVPHYELPREYAWGDVFLFPTIQDGYAAVLAQAQAAGLPIIATENCAAPDIVEPGRTGWVVPIRSPGRIIEHLSWCDASRAAFAEMAGNVHLNCRMRDWSEVAADFVQIVSEARRLAE